MREKLNENPLAQIAVVGVLLVAVGFFALSTMGGGGGGGESGANTTTSSASLTTPEGSATVTATVTTPANAAAPTTAGSAPEVPAPPLPHAVTAAFEAGRTVVLLIAKRGGIDDAMTVAASLPLAFVHGVSLFVVPVARIARYAAITQGVRVERVPALVVVRPKHLDQGAVAASVSYGFQSPESVVQAVRDANYRGATLAYHP